MKFYFSLAFSLIVSCWPVDAPAWDRADHMKMTRLALQDVAAAWDLNHPVEVKPLQSFLEKLSALHPELRDPWRWSDYLKINPKIDLNSLPPQFQRPRLTPLEILTLASIDPDDGRDQDLFIRDEKGNPRYAYPDQKWFGVIKGPNSQAFRHIEKPPFSILRPSSTFGFPLRTLGEATQRTEIYFQASQLAFALSEDYWGWRLLGGALHYLQDLHQPYHAGQITPGLLWGSLKALPDWGWKTRGFMGTFAHLVANSHRFYEAYVEFPSPEKVPEKQKAFNALLGIHTVGKHASATSLAVQARDGSNRLFPQLLKAVDEATTEALRGPYEFVSDEPVTSDPRQFLNTSSERFREADERIFSITVDRFAWAGRAIRTAVDMALRRKNRDEPQRILETLDELLKYQGESLPE